MKKSSEPSLTNWSPSHRNLNLEINVSMVRAQLRQSESGNRLLETHDTLLVLVQALLDIHKGEMQELHEELAGQLSQVEEKIRSRVTSRAPRRIKR